MLSCGIIRDITLRKVAETKLQQRQIEQQALLDLIPAMVWYKDSQNRILRANRRAAESISKSVAEVEGQSTYDLYPEEAEKYHQDDLAVIASGQPKLGIVELYEIAPGHKRWIQTDKVPYRDAQGNVIGVLVFAQDITERRQAEAALQESERQVRDTYLPAKKDLAQQRLDQIRAGKALRLTQLAQRKDGTAISIETSATKTSDSHYVLIIRALM